MLYNKNKVSKTNDKKILHKVGKQWKVVSVALLMAVAGGAVAATHANANADSTDDTVAALNAPQSANAPTFAQSASASTKSAASSSAAQINYYSGYNGSAAMYFDKVDQDNATANKYYASVSGYVKSLGAVYGPQVSSFSAKETSASDAAIKDTKLANSYSAVAGKSTTASTIASLAAKNSMDPSFYQSYVANNEQTYSNAVSGASDDVKAASDVASLANSLGSANLNAAYMSASVASAVAQSNVNGANAVYQSVVNANSYGNSASGWLANVASLKAGASELFADGNPVDNNATLKDLLTNYTVAADRNNVQSNYNTNESAAYSSAAKTFNTALSSSATLSGYLSNESDFSKVLRGYTYTGSDATDPKFDQAVSAAVNTQMSALLTSAVTSLTGKYNPESATDSVLASKASEAIASAKNKLTAAQNLQSVADTNLSLVTNFSSAVSQDASNYAHANHGSSETESDAAANVVMSWLKATTHNTGAVNNFLDTYNYLVSASDTFGPGISAGEYSGAAGDYASVLATSANSGQSTSVQAAVNALVSDGSAIANGSLTSEASVSAAFNADYLALSSVVSNFDANLAAASTANVLSSAATDKYKLSGGANSSSVAKYLASGIADPTVSALAYKLVNSDATVQSGAMFTDGDANSASSLKTAISNATTAFSLLAQDATSVSGTAAAKNGLVDNNIDELVSAPKGDTTAPLVAAALLSDGVDVNQLASESGAIQDVANAASNAANSFSGVNGATLLSDELSVATSSANSAENSAANASAAYSSANDEDVVLASFYAGSYSTDASNESDAASATSASLDSFLQSVAGDPAFASEDNAYNKATQAASTDYKLGVSYAKAVYNANPHFLDVLKTARLHTTPNFGSKDDKVVGFAKKGDRLVVKGVNVSRNGSLRGIIRYAVKDVNNGKSGFFTGVPAFSKGAYLPATLNVMAGVNVKTLKPVKVYSDYQGKKAVGTVPAGKVLSGVTVVYGYTNDKQDAQGFTRVETAGGHFVTANTDYVALYNVPVQNNNNNNYNFNLQNPDQKLGNYYNDTSLN